MKKLLFFLAIAATGLLTAPAQTHAQPIAVRSIHMLSTDGAGTVLTPTITTNTSTYQLGFRCRYKYDLTFDLTNTVLSGTLTGGIAVLFGTNDSVNGPWLPVRGDQINCPNCIKDTLHFSGTGTTTGTWHVSDPVFNYHEFKTYYGGTQTSQPSAVMWYKY